MSRDLFGIRLWDESAGSPYRIRNSLDLNFTNAVQPLRVLLQIRRFTVKGQTCGWMANRFCRDQAAWGNRNKDSARSSLRVW
jgi:hypothetical protein